MNSYFELDFYFTNACKQSVMFRYSQPWLLLCFSALL